MTLDASRNSNPNGSAANDSSAIRKAVDKRDRLERSTDLREALFSIILVVVIALTLSGARSFVTWSISVLIMAGATLQSVTRLILFFRQPGDSQPTPPRDFLVAERNWILARIRTFQIGNWCTVCVMAVSACFIALFSPSLKESLQAIGTATALVALLQITHLFKVHKPLSKRLGSLDRLIAQFDL